MDKWKEVSRILRDEVCGYLQTEFGFNPNCTHCCEQDEDTDWLSMCQIVREATSHIKKIIEVKR